MKSVMIDGVTYVPAQPLTQLAKGDGVRYLHACEVTNAQRDQIQTSELWKAGDAILVWVNEGDLYRWKEST